MTSPRGTHSHFSSLLLALLTVGCAIDVDHAALPVVFGDDDREEYYEASDPLFAELLRSATVALVDPAYIDVSDPENVVPDTITLGEYQELCDGEYYADEPAMASCSGTLIDDDLVLTAAHCIDETVCAEWYFVFDFHMTGPDELSTMTAADVYTCAEILVHEYTPDGEPRPWDDYAIVRLDRPVDGQRVPASVSMDASTLGVGDGITSLGFGNGIPGKIHGGASVYQADPSIGYFLGSTDTFAGNSGSGTYNDDHELVGVFVRGGHDDYAATPDGCQVVNAESEDDASQEYDYADKAVRTLCDSGYESARLCGSEEPEPMPVEPEPEPDPVPEMTEVEGSRLGCRAAPASSSGLGLLVLALAMAAYRARRIARRSSSRGVSRRTTFLRRD